MTFDDARELVKVSANRPLLSRERDGLLGLIDQYQNERGRAISLLLVREDPVEATKPLSDKQAEEIYDRIVRPESVR